MIPKSAALELLVLSISRQNDVFIVAVPEIFREQLLTDIRSILGPIK